MIPRAWKAASVPAWLWPLGLFLLAAVSPGLAFASLPSVSEARPKAFDLPHLPSALDEIERPESGSAACGVFCGEPLDLKLRVGFGGGTPFLSTQDGLAFARRLRSSPCRLPKSSRSEAVWRAVSWHPTSNPCAFKS